MGRKRRYGGYGRLDSGLLANETDPEFVESLPLARVVDVEPERVEACRCCGRYPRLHYANFLDKAAHPKSVYIDCKCGNCIDEWFKDDWCAVRMWNRENQNTKPRPEGAKDDVDFIIDDIMSNFRIPD